MTAPTDWVGGFAGYGIYPEYRDLFALHLFFRDNSCRKTCEAFLKERFDVVWAEEIPVRKMPQITDEPLIWRYFASPLRSALRAMQVDEKEFVVRAAMRINQELTGAPCVFLRQKHGGIQGRWLPGGHRGILPPGGVPGLLLDRSWTLSHQHAGVVGWRASLRPAGLLGGP